MANDETKDLQTTDESAKAEKKKTTDLRPAMIYKKISKIMGEITAISKDRTNPMQKYQFRGIDDVYNMMHKLLAKHGVFTVPRVVNKEIMTRTSKSGGAMFQAVLTIDYAFYAEDGSFINAIVVGEGLDSSDKACNKAMSAAHKYAFIQMFSIPTSEDKDAESDTPETIVGNNKQETPPAQQTQEDKIAAIKAAQQKNKGIVHPVEIVDKNSLSRTNNQVDLDKLRTEQVKDTFNGEIVDSKQEMMDKIDGMKSEDEKELDIF